LERRERRDGVPADRDIAEILYSGERQTLSLKYHQDAGRVVWATRKYTKVAHGEGVDDEVDWNPKNHAAFHVRTRFCTL